MENVIALQTMELNAGRDSSIMAGSAASLGCDGDVQDA